MTEGGDATIEIAATSPCTEAEGPLRRFAVWVQGCTLACPGCCNPEMFERGRGRSVAIAELHAAIVAAARTHRLDGITVLGGEPLQQAAAVASLCERVAADGLGVIVFSGYRVEEARHQPDFERLWASIDTLVDGRFEAKQAEHARRFIGSRNQSLVHRTGRYADPTAWAGAPVVELEVAPGAPLRLVGAPALVRRVVGRVTRPISGDA